MSDNASTPVRRILYVSSELDARTRDRHDIASKPERLALKLPCELSLADEMKKL